MDLKLLRDATRPEHEATESAVPLMQPGLTRAAYIAVLHRFHGVVSAWDTMAEAYAPAPLRELVRQRRRSPSLEADLRFFGAAPAAFPPSSLCERVARLFLDPTDTPNASAAGPRFVGAMYVLEGSTLGGQYIAQHVEAALDLEPGEGDCFFRGYGKETMPRWREFQQVLLAVPDAEGSLVIEAAKEMFGIFREWMTQAENGMPQSV